MLSIREIIGKFVKNSSQRDIDKLKSIVKQINDLEPKIKDISDEQFPLKTDEFKSKIQKGVALETSSFSLFTEAPPPISFVFF